MLQSIIGNKVGMTQIFDEIGNIIPVTIIHVDDCKVMDIRTKEKDGYTALQLGVGKVKEKSLSKPLMGQFKKKNLVPKKFLYEVKVDDVSKFQIGQDITVDLFKNGDYVDVSGVSKGKGFAGVMKRHNFGGGPITHGQSDRQRAVGSVGAQRPTHTIKGKRMPGHLGDELVTVQKIKIATIDKEKSLIMLKGSVPGAKKCLLVIKKTVKKVTPPEAKLAQMKKGKAKAAKPAAAAAKPAGNKPAAAKPAGK